MTRDEWDDALAFVRQVHKKRPVSIGQNATIKDVLRGGIVGVAEIVDCVKASDSPWFVGDYGFVLANVEPLPFHPCKGMLGFFDVPGFEHLERRAA